VSNDIKAVITLVVTAFLIVVMMIWGSADADVRPRLVSGLFTLAAGVAVGLAIWQLGRQAGNKNDANGRIGAYRDFFRNRKPILAAVGLWLLALAAYSQFPVETISPDLAGNLIAEATGIVVTVGLIQWLIEQNENRRTRAARFQAYNEATRLH